MSVAELFPSGLYNTPIMARAYVVYKTSDTTYEVAYSDPLVRSISYVSYALGDEAEAEGQLIDKAGSAMNGNAVSNALDGYIVSGETFVPTVVLGGMTVDLTDVNDIEVSYTVEDAYKQYFTANAGQNSLTVLDSAKNLTDETSITITATAISKDTDLIPNFTTTFSVPIVTKVADHTAAKLVQGSMTATLSATFNANGKSFVLYDESGKTLATYDKNVTGTQNGITYSGSAITLSAAYLNSLPVGLNKIYAKVQDGARSYIEIPFYTYGEKDGMLYASDRGEDFESVTADTIGDVFGSRANTTDVNQSGGVEFGPAHGSTAKLVTGENALSGKQSLEVTTGTSAATSKTILEFLRFNQMCTDGRYYTVSMKLRVLEMPSNGIGNIFLRFSQEVGDGGTGDNTQLSVVQVRQLGNKFCYIQRTTDGRSTLSSFAYDEESDVLTMRTVMKCNHSGGGSSYTCSHLYLCTQTMSSSYANTWKIVVDDISMTTYNYYTEMYNQPFKTSGSTLTEGAEMDANDGFFCQGAADVTATYAEGATGGWAAKFVTNNDGAKAQFNNMAHSRLIESTVTAGTVAGQRYMVHFKFTFKMPEHLEVGEEGKVMVRFIDMVGTDGAVHAGSNAVNGVEIVISKTADGGYDVRMENTTDRDTWILYDPSRGVVSVTAFVTPTSSNQYMYITTFTPRQNAAATFGKWTLVLDDLYIANVFNYGYVDANFPTYDFVENSSNTSISTSLDLKADVYPYMTHGDAIAGNWLNKNANGNYGYTYVIAPRSSTATTNPNTTGEMLFFHNTVIPGFYSSGTFTQKTRYVSVSFLVNGADNNGASNSVVNGLWFKDSNNDVPNATEVASVRYNSSTGKYTVTGNGATFTQKVVRENATTTRVLFTFSFYYTASYQHFVICSDSGSTTRQTYDFTRITVSSYYNQNN